MKKIPTLFQRTDDRRHVTDAVTPGCEWVLEGEGRATRKFDGTCILIRGDHTFARREVKPGKDASPPARRAPAKNGEPTKEPHEYQAVPGHRKRHGGPTHRGLVRFMPPRAGRTPFHRPRLLGVRGRR